VRLLCLAVLGVFLASADPGPLDGQATGRQVVARYLPAEAPPASTLMQVIALYRPELIIEIAAEAVLPARNRTR
jgi:hypothetical protein